MATDKGVLGSLFDVEFESLITMKIIKVVYVVFLVVVTLFAGMFFLASFASGAPGAVFGLIIAPLAWFLYVVMARLSLEIFIVIFRMGDDLRTLVERGSPATPPPSPSGGYPPPTI